MTLNLEIASLNELRTPVMMCGQDGVVIYKNNAAMKEIKLPKRNTHVVPHLSVNGASELASVWEYSKPLLITIDTGEGKVRAFVTPYERRGIKCTLWVFVQLIQVSATAKYAYSTENDIITVSKEICDIVKAIDEKSFIAGDTGVAPIDRRIRKKIDKIISYVFFNSGEPLYPVPKGMELLISAVDKTFSRFGYDIKHSYYQDDSAPAYYMDFKSFSLFFFHMLAFFAECGSGKSMNAEFGVFDSTLQIKLLFTMPYPPFYADEECKIDRLFEFAPRNIIDILVFKRMTEMSGYTISYSVNDDSYNNVSVHIDIPVIKKAMLRETMRYDEFEGIFIENDTILMYTNMLKARTL